MGESATAGTGGDDTRGDAQLLPELVAGDRAAFTQLYDLTSSRIYGLAVRVVRDRHYAEVIVQKAYLQYWEKAGDYHPARGSVITFDDDSSTI